MKNNVYLLFLLLLTGFCRLGYAQNFSLHRAIMVTDTVEDDGVIFPASTDDVEQINQEIDALYDDDLDAGWEGAPEDQNVVSVGLRFRNISIPKGAVIDSAFLILHAHEGKDAEDVAILTLVGEDGDDAATFSEDALVTDRPQTSAQVSWTVAEDWEIWQPYRSPDVRSVIQEIVDRAGWAAGNDLAVFLLGQNQGVTDVENAREFESFENISDPEDGGDGQNHPERRPQLLIYYSVSNARLESYILPTDTITDDGVTFEASSDDAEQINDEMDSLFDDDLDAGWEGAPEDQNVVTVGLRFRHVAVPHGAVVDSAFIQIWAHEGKNPEDLALIRITGEANDNAETYTEDALISDRPQTGASVLWQVDQEWVIWEKYQTPDLKDIVQEIIDRAAWQEGNALAFVLAGQNQGVTDVENAREFESYENISDPEDGGDGQNHPERRPRLVIYYSSPSAVSLKEVFRSTVKTMKVYPNPARAGQVYLELDADGPAHVRLFNASGQEVRNLRAVYGKTIVLPVQGLPAGTYYAQAIRQGSVYIQKLVLQP